MAKANQGGGERDYSQPWQKKKKKRQNKKTSANQNNNNKTRELGSSGPYAMLFCLDYLLLLLLFIHILLGQSPQTYGLLTGCPADDLDKKKHRDVINSLKILFFKT